MNILLSTYSFGAGRGSEAGVGWNVARGLAQRGHSVTVLTTSEFRHLNLPALEKEDLDITLIEEDCGITDFPQAASYRKWQRSIAPTIRSLSAQQSFDIVHHLTFNQYRWVYDVFATDLPYVIGPVGGAELIPAELLSYGNMPFSMRVKELIRYCSLDVLPLITRCRKHRKQGIILTSNQATAKRLSSLTVAPIICPAIAIHQNEIVTIPAPESDKNTFILFDGSLARPQKGTMLAMKAMAGLWQKNHRIPLRIVGLTSQEISAIRKYAGQLNLPENALQLEGFITRATMLQYMQQAAVMLSCVYRDSGSMALLEALAQGCRIVCLDIPSQEWLPGQFCRKVTVQPTAVAMENALVSALQQELTAPANTEERHAARAQWLRENMSWEARLNSFEAFYRELLP